MAILCNSHIRILHPEAGSLALWLFSHSDSCGGQLNLFTTLRETTPLEVGVNLGDIFLGPSRGKSYLQTSVLSMVSGV